MSEGLYIILAGILVIAIFVFIIKEDHPKKAKIISRQWEKGDRLL